MQWKEDAWLSGQMSLPVFRVDVEPSASTEPFQNFTETHPHLFCYTKVSVQDTKTVTALTQAGFSVVDVNLLFSYQPSDQKTGVSDTCTIRLCTSEDEDGVLSIAESAFQYSRFHLDSNISPSVANAIKRAWIQNYILGKRGDALWVAVLNNQPVGFLAVITSQWDNRDCAIIDLIGVSNTAQGKGIGTALVQFFQQEYRKKYPVLLVGTQAANIPSVRLYEKLGFRLCDSKYVLHYYK